MVTDYYLPTLGGVQTVIKAHKETLEQDGHDVLVCTPLARPSDDPTVLRLPTARWFAPDGYPFTWSPGAAAAALRSMLQDARPDVVHIHTEMFAALAGYEAARSLGIPVVQTMHGRIDVYTRSVLPIPPVSTAVLAAMHRRRMSHDRVRLDGSAPYAGTRTARRMWRLMVSQANHADHVIVPSAHFAAKLRRQGVHTPLTVLSNGLEQTVLARIGSPEPRRVAAGRPLRVVWCGRLSPEKRPEVFVDAVAQTPGIVAHMFGDGIARRDVARRAAPLAGRLHLHGAVPQQEVVDAMRDAHLLVSSSLDFDNQPMVILEGIAAGLPTVVTDPDLAEMLPLGGGAVSRSADAVGLAATLAELRDDPGRITGMSAAAIAHRDSVAQDTHRDALLAVYRSALADAAQGRPVRRRSTPGRDGRTSR